VFSAGLVAGATATDAVRAFIAFLSSRAAAPLIEATGLEPLAAR
jgi:ABC-type Fe3+ transport system substrate-binding protein